MTGSTTLSSIRPFHDVGDVLGPTLKLFFQNFWLITKIVIVIVAPFEVFRILNLENLPDNWQLTVGVLLLDHVCKVLIAPALIYALMKVMQTGIAPSLNESYRWGFSKLGKLIICAALSLTLQALGFALCIIPGIVVYLSLIVAYPIVILENGSVTGALELSRDLTRGHRWNILGASILLMLVMGVPAGVGEILVLATGGLRPLHVAAAILSDIFEQSLTVLSLVTYLSIRALWSQSTQ
jgi:uncharacterized membrane protein